MSFRFPVSVRPVLVTVGLAAVMLLAPAAGQAGGTAALAWSPSVSGSFDYGAVSPGQTASQTFTLMNSGGSATGMLTVVLSGSTAFALTADACTGTSLGPGKSCTATVEFAPAERGKSGTGTLNASGMKASANASITLTGPPNLHLSPGTFLTTYANGEKLYGYEFAPAVSGATQTQTFTVSNDGNGASRLLDLSDCCSDPAFVLANNACSGNALAAAGTCTFDLSFTTPTLCTELDMQLEVIGINPFTQYILLSASACVEH
jgi:hypothetical protein